MTAVPFLVEASAASKIGEELNWPGNLCSRGISLWIWNLDGPGISPDGVKEL